MDHRLEFIMPVLEILEIEVSNILYNPRNTDGAWAAPRARARGGFDYLWNMCPGMFGYPANMMFMHFLIFTKKHAPKFHAEPRRSRAEISHMRPIQARKLKLKIDPFPKPHKNI